jgi:isocitrate dehydrogenase kinase/phosphatase
LQKEMTAAHVRACYQLVKEHDRVGRMADTQEFENYIQMTDDNPVAEVGQFVPRLRLQQRQQRRRDLSFDDRRPRARLLSAGKGA